MKSLCIYEWRSWDGFLLPMMFPEATRLRARIGEPSSALLARLPADARTFLFHVNLTDTRRTPLRRRAFSRALRSRGIRILNEHITDISKHRLQALCSAAGLHSTLAPPHGEPDELVIVKTNANYGGEKEKFLSGDERRVLGLGARCRWIERHDGYVIGPRRDVPPAYWRSRQIIVERYIDNRRHVFYRAHKVGDRMIISRMVNPAGIKKMLQQIRRTNWYFELPDLTPRRGPLPVPAPVASAVRRVCTELGLDIGSIDVLEDDDGRCYVVDVNASPFWGEAGYDHMLRFLAAGLDIRVRPARVTSAGRSTPPSSAAR